MGVWGTGIFTNDVACDVRSQFREMLANGKSPRMASQTILREWRPALEDVEDGPVIWLALAAVQCQYCCLEKLVRSKALAIIDEGTYLERWQQGDPKLMRRRNAVLDRLRSKLDAPQRPCTKPYKNPIPRKRLLEPKANWPLGEVFAYPLRSGYYMLLHVWDHSSSRQTRDDPIFAVLKWRGKRIPSAKRILELPLKTTIEINDYKEDLPRERMIFLISVITRSRKPVPNGIVRLSVERPRHQDDGRPRIQGRMNGGYHVCHWDDFDERVEEYLKWK